MMIVLVEVFDMKDIIKGQSFITEEVVNESGFGNHNGTKKESGRCRLGSRMEGLRRIWYGS